MTALQRPLNPDATVGRLLLAAHDCDDAATEAVLDELDHGALRQVVALLAEGLALAEAESFEDPERAAMDAMRRIRETLDDWSET